MTKTILWLVALAGLLSLVACATTSGSGGPVTGAGAAVGAIGAAVIGALDALISSGYVPAERILPIRDGIQSMAEQVQHVIAGAAEIKAALATATASAADANAGVAAIDGTIKTVGVVGGSLLAGGGGVKLARRKTA